MRPGVLFLWLTACGAPVPDGDGDGVERGDGDGDGFSIEAGDCDDLDPEIAPGAAERCDGVDQDCNGTIDDAPVDGETYYVDDDRDGYGSDRTLVACARPDEYATRGGDCDDADSGVNPGADDTADEDANCDGRIDGPTGNSPPIIVRARAGVFYSSYDDDDIWEYEATVDDPNGVTEVVGVQADVLDLTTGGTLVESYPLNPTDDPSLWSSAWFGSTTLLDPFWPNYSVVITAFDVNGGSGELTIRPDTY